MKEMEGNGRRYNGSGGARKGMKQGRKEVEGRKEVKERRRGERKENCERKGVILLVRRC
jgi:hypothetical protein